MTKAILLIVVVFFMTFNKRLQGKTLQKTVKGIKSSEQSILRASRSVFGGFPGKKKIYWQKEETKPTSSIHENVEKSEGRARKKRFLTWRGSIMRGLKIKIKLKTKNVGVCTVFLAYTLSDKCKILRIRLK